MSDPAERCLIFDRREEFGERPGLHALLIGVSDYPNLPPVSDKPKLGAGGPDFGLRPLSATARSADALALWMVAHADRFTPPLATCRLLASPSVPGPGGWAERADLAHVTSAANAWRDDAAKHPDGTTLFYFAGHGLQRRHLEESADQVLLLEGFGDGQGTFKDGWRVKDLIDAMAPGLKKFQKIARTQYYFLDACRNAPEALDDLERTSCAAPLEIFKHDPAGSPKVADFRVTQPDRRAYAHPGGLTHFAAALLKCLDGGAGQIDQAAIDPNRPAWKLTADALHQAISYYLPIENDAEHVSQSLAPNLGNMPNVTFCRFEDPPRLPVQVLIDPAASRTCTQVNIIDDFGSVIWPLPKPVDPHPHDGLLVSGYYRYHAIPDKPAVERRGRTVPHNTPGTVIQVYMH